MRQTENTAIVLRYANYRDYDRMLTLLSPTRGKLEVLSRGCRRPKSPLLNASELFALGDFQLYTKQERATLVSANLLETFYPLRGDFDRLSVGVYLLNLAEAAVQPGEPCQELFMLLLHTLSRLTFSDQEWKPLLAGFLLHYAAVIGFKPRLVHCVGCGRHLTEGEQVYFDLAEGGLCCEACHGKGTVPLAAGQARLDAPEPAGRRVHLGEHPGGLRPLRAAAGLCGAAVGPSPAQRGHAAQMRRGGAIPLKILLLTDIHGNLPALEAVLNTPQARSADRVVSAGDHTGFGPCPRQVTERLRSLGAEILAGNHEERLPQADAPEFAGYNWSLLRWTREQLAGLPLAWPRTLAPG